MKTQPAGNSVIVKTAPGESRLAETRSARGQIKVQNQKKPNVLKFSRYIPMHLKRFVFQRSQGQCEFIDGHHQKRCENKFRLQIDHVRPIALGGKTEKANLRHLCQAHNLRMAQEMGLEEFRLKRVVSPSISPGGDEKNH